MGKDMEHHKLQIEGMTCNACSAVIKSKLGSLPDVSCVRTDWQAGTVQFVTPDSATELSVERTIEDLGYAILEHTPTEEQYDESASVEG
jgi:copper chaperone CopZ